uniref:Hint domain-containing protein n=1 Tax=Flavobacterium sp. TaxID=239 RepID=UPI0039E3FA8C
FRGSKAEVNDFANHLKKMSDTEAKKFLDDIAKGNKLKLAEKMWEKYTYLDFTAKPPVKPCFLGGTLIHTTKGLVAIENITNETEVYCYDEIKQTLTTRKVSETYKNQAEKYLKVTTQSGEVIAVTGQHLFYQKTSQTWIKGHQLKVGMKLYNAQNNQLENITALKIIEQTVHTYNFEVPTHHNYLVGKTGFLAHNANKFKSINDTTTRRYAFYMLNTEIQQDDNFFKKIIEYIGKTTRESLNIRNEEHVQHGKVKGPNSKHYWKFKDEPQIAHINQGDLRYVEMTNIQSDVWEKYYLEKYRYETGRPLKNIQNPISEKRFNALKASGKHKNICLFFI